MPRLVRGKYAYPVKLYPKADNKEGRNKGINTGTSEQVDATLLFEPLENIPYERGLIVVTSGKLKIGTTYEIVPVGESADVKITIPQELVEGCKKHESVYKATFFA